MSHEIKEITVYLDEEQAKQFVLFQKHYRFFSLLIDKKVFNQRGAEVSLHFDSKGSLNQITRKDLLFSSKYDFDNTNPTVL